MRGKNFSGNNRSAPYNSNQSKSLSEY
jgi:hypothetical protein